MLRITQQDSAKDAKRYYASADYYSEGQEIVGSWGGKGALRLGLSGVVDRESFDRLCDNLDPAGNRLTARTRSQRTVGYDFTFSVPKSVSVLYALTGDADILEAFRASVDDTMRDMESEMKTRVRKGGRDADRATGNMIWAEFIHTTSRPVEGVPDPQLHAHCFVFNTTWDNDENRWKAGQFRELKADAPYFQAGFRVRLANRLQELGFSVERKRDDFELAGVSSSLIRRFSRRTDEIEKVASERGITDPRRKAELGAQTREKKNQQYSWNQLRKFWDGRLSDKERQTIAATHRREVAATRPAAGEGQAVDFALEHSFAREAVVAERRLLTEALKRGMGGVTVEGVKQEFSRRNLIRGNVDGRAVASTSDVLGEERRVVEFAKSGRGKFRPLGDAARPLSRGWLNEGQRAAVLYVMGSRDRVTLIRGAAGTGKTTLMREAVEQIESNGHKVTVLAPSVGASFDVLRNEGFAEANTVARFVRDKAMQQEAAGQVIWIDEAGLLGTQDMARLFDVAKEADARLVLSGDRRQHRGVARGEPLKLLEKKAGLPVAEVTEIMRQSGSYRKAVSHLSAGRTAEGFAELDRLGWIREVSGGVRYKELAHAYLAAVGRKGRDGKPATALVVSPTHAEAARITSTIRDSLKDGGKLSNERTITAWVPLHLTAAQKSDAASYRSGDMLQFHQNAPGHRIGSRLVVSENGEPPAAFAERFEAYRPVALSLAAGDRIRVSARGKTKDGKHLLSNGALLTLRGFTPRGDLIADNGWVIDKQFGHIAHGYVVTSHASQGKTVENVFIGQSAESLAASNRRQFYVSVSRGKAQAVIFTDDKKELMKAVARADEPMSASELADGWTVKPPLTHRLKKVLARMRRVANFNQAHDARWHGPERTPPTEREPLHVR
jgi:conjugative relaxase-like TrwC/TraI family protein